VGGSAAVGEIEHLLQEAVGHHLIFGGRGHQKLAGGLVGGVIDHGQPLSRQGGPVPTEKGAVAELVPGDVQAVARDATVFHDELAALAGGGGGIEGDGEAVGGVLKLERRTAGGDFGDGHALAVSDAG
jgi:hypothetical protein